MSRGPGAIRGNFMKQTVQLEKRRCNNCGKQFKVMVESKQTICSSDCEKLGKVEWEDLRSPLSDDGSGPESVSVSVTPTTKPSDWRSSIDAKRMAWKKNKKENTMRPQENGPLSGEKNGRPKIAHAKTRLKEPTTPQIKSDSANSSMPEKDAAILSMVSKEQSGSVPIVSSVSMNLLDDSAQHLHGLMRGLFANIPGADVRAYDPDRVNSACNCAKQIYSIMRLKLDCIKVQLGNEKKQ